MKIIKEKFENDLLDHYENVTDNFGPTAIEIVRNGQNNGTSYKDRRTNNIIAHWCKGRGEFFNFNSAGYVLPRLKINLKNRRSHLTPARIWYSIERKAKTSR